MGQQQGQTTGFEFIVSRSYSGRRSADAEIVGAHMRGNTEGHLVKKGWREIHQRVQVTPRWDMIRRQSVEQHIVFLH